MKPIKPKQKLEPILEKITLPVRESQKERYRKIERELYDRRLTNLHELTREKIDELLDQVEVELAKSS